MSEVFDLDNLLAQRDQGGRSYLEFLRVPAMSAGIYILPAGGGDLQRPHEQDEIYYVLSGRAKLRLANQEKPVAEGNVIFVEAKLDHRFFEIEEELVLLVVFAPAEESI
jgi:mannose-6-phosphate isomerase-like protein (cupin superfamily)